MHANNSVSRRMAYAMRHDLHSTGKPVARPALPKFCLIRGMVLTAPDQDHRKVLLPMSVGAKVVFCHA